jgi:hypothetical protein
MAALEEDLDAAVVIEFAELEVHFVLGEDIMVGVFLRAVEGAEFAIDVADVGVIDIAVDDVGDDAGAAAGVGVALDLVAAAIGELAEFLERQAVEFEGLVGRDAVAGEDFVD